MIRTTAELALAPYARLGQKSSGSSHAICRCGAVTLFLGGSAPLGETLVMRRSTLERLWPQYDLAGAARFNNCDHCSSGLGIDQDQQSRSAVAPLDRRSEV